VTISAVSSTLRLMVRIFWPPRLALALAATVGTMAPVSLRASEAAPSAEVGRAAVLGEFGDLGCPTPGHIWTERR
jgi:hypothetical protein